MLKLLNVVLAVFVLASTAYTINTNKQLEKQLQEQSVNFASLMQEFGEEHTCQAELTELKDKLIFNTEG